MATFTYTPDWNARVAVKPRVRTVTFGDGYEQRQSDGINTRTETWDLRFQNRDDTEAGLIEQFFDLRAGVESFYWTPPNELTPIVVVCREWNKTFDRYNLNTISAQFVRVYEP